MNVVLTSIVHRYIIPIHKIRTLRCRDMLTLPAELTRLYETLPDEPEDTDDTDRDMIYCHRCGGSVPGTYSICPECGCVLGR